MATPPDNNQRLVWTRPDEKQGSALAPKLKEMSDRVNAIRDQGNKEINDTLKRAQDLERRADEIYKKFTADSLKISEEQAPILDKLFGLVTQNLPPEEMVKQSDLLNKQLQEIDVRLKALHEQVEKEMNELKVKNQ